MAMDDARDTNKNYIQNYLEENGLESAEADAVVHYGFEESGDIAIPPEAALELDGTEFETVEGALSYVREETGEVPEDQYAVDFDWVGSTDGK